MTPLAGRTGAVAWFLALASAAAAGCATPASGQDASSDRQLVTLHGQPIAVHLFAGTSHRAGPLLLYATGDGGWPGGEALFDRMKPWGYPMAGINSADYVSLIDGPGGVTGPGPLAKDFAAVVDAAVRGLNLNADTPVVIVGFSRGSGLAVAAAVDPAFRARLSGLLTVALTGEEEYVAERPAGETDGPGVMLKLYEALPRLGPLRVAVIQSTRDEFLPAADAQKRFGPDTSSRRFRAIDAADHSFGGKLAELGAEMKAGVDWILRR